MNSYPQTLFTGVQNLWDTPNPMRKVIRQLTRGCTLDAYSQHPEFRDLDKNEVSFSYLVKKKIDRKRIHLLLLITSVIAIQGSNTAYGQTNSIDHLKLYAHSRIIDYKEFQCFNQLITKESNWNVNAINGSHYGLGQMRNPKYRNLDGYRQIDWSLRYIKARYSGSSCKALQHWQSKGWH